ncbi:MAG: hypothetical protein M0T72_03245 [Candidatus Dormibacteraeota bacterium]|nr:hypothetical protein [Candidatus Dormibacteraeota bacterium]
MRPPIGHRRRGAQEQLEGPDSLYEDLLRPRRTCFQPVMKLTGKKSVGNQGRKLHHRPTTPRQRVLAGGQAEPLTTRQSVAHCTTTSPPSLERQPTASWPDMPAFLGDIQGARAAPHCRSRAA